MTPREIVQELDKHIIGPILDHLETCGDHRLLVLPDHPTPINLRTHVHEAVPFACCGTGIDELVGRLYPEFRTALCDATLSDARGGGQLPVGEPELLGPEEDLAPESGESIAHLLGVEIAEGQLC